MGVTNGEALLRRLQASMAYCRKCRARITAEVGQRGAMKRNIGRSDVVVCPRCSTVYTMRLVPGNMQLLDDVTAQYPASAKSIKGQVRTPKPAAKCSKCGKTSYNLGICSECGYKDWGFFGFMFVVSVAFILLAVFLRVPIRWLAGIIGGILFIMWISMLGAMTKKKSNAAKPTEEPDGAPRSK